LEISFSSQLCFSCAAIGGAAEILLPDQSYCTENYPFMFFEIGYVDGNRLEEWVKKYNVVEIEVGPGGM
jgi:hypothetical protein